MTQTQTQEPTAPFDPAVLDGYEQLMAMGEGLLPGPPLAETLGLVAFGGERGAISVELDPQVRHYNPMGVVHGGVLATMLDTAAGCSVHSTLAVGEVYTTLDLTVKFLRQVTAESGRLRAVGKVIQRGRRTALAEAQVLDGQGRLVAHAMSSCMIFS